VESEFELEIICFDTMINYQFSQNLKLLKNCEFSHLNIILTEIVFCPYQSLWPK
jgi:hypothetical protein